MSEASGTAALLQELEDWHSWLDNALVLDALMQMAIEEAEQSSTGETGLSPELQFCEQAWHISANILAHNMNIYTEGLCYR